MQGRRLFLILVPFFLAGCTVNQTMTLKTDLSGTTSVSVSLHDFFIEYLQSLADSIGGESAGGQRSIFDLDQIALSFAMQPELELVSAKSRSAGSLDLSVKHGVLDRVFSGVARGASNVFTVSRSSGTVTLKFHLDRKNFDSLARLLPLYETGKSMYLFPDPSSPMNEEEYLDYLAWAFEGAAPGVDVKSALRSSVVKVKVDIKGTVVSQVGGTLSGTGVEYSIPVLRALTLDKPLDLSVTFRP